MILDERVRARLAATTRFRDVRLLDVTDSTNKVVAGLAAAGAAEGLVVAADQQTAGRGRLDRTWEARAGDALLVSILLRPTDLPPRRWHLLTAATALAAVSACQAVASVHPWIKWPNDLMLDQAKLAGILAEASRGAVVVGMGLNVSGGPPGSAYLEQASRHPVDRSELMASWLEGLDHLLGDWEAVSTRYRQSCATVGSQVDVTTADATYQDVLVEAIDANGCLVIATASGSVTVAAGDVTHLRPAHGTGWAPASHPTDGSAPGG